MIFNMSGGGASLNFKVFGNPQPANPAENSIWIDTDIDIPSVSFTFAEPANPVEGMVWIYNGASSPVAFNALKKNEIRVYPISAKQYVSGAWVSKTAQSYQNGSWESWTTYYYKEGNTYDDVTGGYTHDTDTTLEADNMKMYTDGDGATAYATTNNKVDVSGISTLYVKFNIKAVSSYTRTARVYFCASDSKLTTVGGSVGSGAEAYKDYSAGTNAEDTIALDVSSVTGSKYIFVGVKNTGKYFTVTTNIKEIRGE